MATAAWLGTAPPVAKVSRATPGGTIAVGNTFTVTLGSEKSGVSQSLVVTCTGTTVASVCDDIVAAMLVYSTTFDSAYSLFYRVTPADVTTHVSVTSVAAGEPHYLSVSKAQAGGATDLHTFTASVQQANCGPSDWNIPANWTTDAVPVGTDEIVFDSRGQAPVLFGLDQDAVTVAAIWHHQSFPYALGQTTIPLQIRCNGVVRLGITPSTGEAVTPAPWINLDLGSTACTILCQSSKDTYLNGIPAYNLKTASASTTLTLSGGVVGVGTALPGETVTIGDMYATGGTLSCGSGVTWDDIIAKNAVIDVSSAGATVTMTNSTLRTQGVGAVTTVTAKSGSIDWAMRPAAGAGITTLTLGDGPGNVCEFDLSGNAAGLTVTNLTHNKVYNPIIALTDTQLTVTTKGWTMGSDGIPAGATASES